MTLRRRASEALRIADPFEKAKAARALQLACGSADGAGAVSGDRRVEAIGESEALTVDLEAGRPPQPRLVDPAALPRRSAFTLEGRAALLHSVAHIEFNAINLALDAAARFDGLPAAYYRDWLRVAGEEALHFSLLVEHLATLGHAYGDFDAHDGLWTMATRTAGDFVARMALVPRTLEARGLDATPPMQARLARAGDLRAAEILGVILADEIGHVAVGNRWYRFGCARDGLDPRSHYAVLAARHGAPRPKPPFNREARLAAGFGTDEMDDLEAAG